MIDIHNLNISYETNILSDIKLSIDSHISILGNNGSGKSSFAKSLVDLIDFSGDIKIYGKNIKDYDKKELSKTITYIPTKLVSSNLNLKVFDYLLYSRYIYKKQFFDFESSQKNEVYRVLNQLDLVYLKDKFISDLSTGEQSLVLVASSIIQNPKIIIFDEPTANLDPKNHLKIAKIIKKLKQNSTIILITHDILFAKFFDEDILFLKEKNIYKYKKEIFFNDKFISNLYGITFHNLGLVYEE